MNFGDQSKQSVMFFVCDHHIPIIGIVSQPVAFVLALADRWSSRDLF